MEVRRLSFARFLAHDIFTWFKLRYASLETKLDSELISPSHRPFSTKINLRSSTLFDFGGGKEVRTPDPLLAKQVLSQLSYTPDVANYIPKLLF